MKLKRFVATDTRGVIQQIKATFGPDAIILFSHHVEGGVEVVAATATAESLIQAEKYPPQTPIDDMRQEIQIVALLAQQELKLFQNETGSCKEQMCAGREYYV